MEVPKVVYCWTFLSEPDFKDDPETVYKIEKNLLLGTLALRCFEGCEGGQRRRAYHLNLLRKVRRGRGRRF